MPLWVYDETGRLVTSQGAFEFTLTADSGSNQTVNNGETVDIAGGVGIATTASATNTVTIDSVWDYEQVLGSSGSFDVTLSTDVTGWDSTVKSIVFEVGLRSTVSATTDNAVIFFNNDTTATNYYIQLLGSNNGLAALAQASNSIFCRCPANTSTSNSFALGTFVIPMPNSTNYLKVVKPDIAGYLTTNIIENSVGSVTWVTGGTSAITRIQIRTDNHPTDLFATNSFIRIRLVK